MKKVNLYNDDCINTMQELIKERVKVDAIITDIPYNATSCEWDKELDYKKIFDLCYKLRKDSHTPIVLFGIQPFTSKLINLNIENFKYEWIYQKVVGSNFT